MEITTFSSSVNPNDIDWLEWNIVRCNAFSIRVGCQWYLPVEQPHMNIPLPPDRMEIYIGRKEGEFYYTLSFQTNEMDKLSCSSSISVVARNKSTDRIDESETYKAQTKYTGLCLYDHDFVPSRTILVTGSPVSDKDLVAWECSAMWGDREIAAPALHLPYEADWNVPPTYRYPQLEVVPRVKNGPMKVACVVPGYEERVPPKFWGGMPYLEVGIKRYRDNVETGYAFRDVYGRFSKATKNYPVEVKSQCTKEDTNAPEFFCLGGDPRDLPDQHLPLGFQSQCSQVALVMSSATRNDSKIKFNDAIPILETSNLMQNYFEAFETDSDNVPFLVMDFNRPHVVIQLPSDKGVEALRIHTEHTPKISTLGVGGADLTMLEYQVHVMIDEDILISFYSVISRSIIDFPLLKGLKTAPYVDSNNNVKAELSCGPDGGRIVFMASGVCDIEGGTVSTEESTLMKQKNNWNKHGYEDEQKNGSWCGERGGDYAVHTRDLKPGELVLITKRKQILTKTYQNYVMTCLWRQYYCLTGSRTHDLKTFTYMDPDPSEQGLNKLQLYQQQIQFGGKPVSPWEVIGSDGCPIGESKTDLPNGIFVSPRFPKAHFIDTTNVGRFLKNVATEPGNSLAQKYAREQTLPSQLKDACLCRQTLNLCNISTVQDSVGYAVMDLEQTDLEDTFTCNVMGRTSDKRTFASMITDYVCPDKPDDSWKYSFLSSLTKRLPQVYLTVAKNIVTLSDGDEYVRVSCKNVKRKCFTNLKLGLPDSHAFLSLTSENGTHLVVQLDDGVQWVTFMEKTTEAIVTVNNTDPVRHHPVVLVESPHSPFLDEDVHMEYLLRKSYLQQFNLLRCTYLDGLVSSARIDVHPNLETQCTNLDYAVTVETDLTKTDVMAISCKVAYSTALNKSCGKPSIKLSVQKPDGDANLFYADVLCPEIEGDSVTVGRVRSSFSDSGERLVRFLNNSGSGRGYCLYNDSSNETSTTLLLSTSEALNTLEATCHVKQTAKEIAFSSTTKLDTLSTASCVPPPSIFSPVVKAPDEMFASSRSLVSCSLPDWTHSNVCKNNQRRQGKVIMYVETSSNFKQHTRHLVATLNPDGSCDAAKGHVCLTELPGKTRERLLMAVLLNDDVVHDIANDPGATLLLSCTMAGITAPPKQLLLTEALNRMASLKFTPTAVVTSLPNHPYKPNDSGADNLYSILMLVVPVIGVTVVVAVIVLVAAVLRRAKDKNAYKKVQVELLDILSRRVDHIRPMQ